MSANAIETLRQVCTYADQRYIDTPPLDARFDALAAVEAEHEAAKLAVTHARHSRGCAIYEPPWLGRRTSGSPACTCGVDDLRAAVRRVETGQ